MLTFDQIKELVELVGRYRLSSVEIERAGFKVRITGTEPRESAPVAAAPVAVAMPAAEIVAPKATAAAPSEAPAAPAEAPAPDPSLHTVTSPIVGTFYAAPNPDAAAFVRVGDRVRKGQVLCIVEAMKLMNEIESDADGVIAEIYPKNAQPVEFGEPLFALRAD